MRPLAVTARERIAQLPDIPTTAEAGLPDVEMSSWVALLAPAGTPAAVIARINAEANAALAEDDLRRTIAEHGAKPEGGSAVALADFLAAERGRWKRVIAIAGITVD
jgi:tripartite-type tricarboxylate transporter receptor subunit TctC